MPYRQVRLLGNGYFGEVWLEQDMAIGRLCAAKYPDMSLTSATQAFKEADFMSKADHENVVRIYSADEANERPVIRMEYLERGSVFDLYGDSPAPVADAIGIIEDACRGIEFLHSREILHRDIKPANLLLTSSQKVKVSTLALQVIYPLYTKRVLLVTCATCHPNQLATVSVTLPEIFTASALRSTGSLTERACFPAPAPTNTLRH